MSDLEGLLRSRLSAYRPRGISTQRAATLPEAAVLIALSEGGDGPTVLLTERAKTLSLHPGEIAFPGGKRDPEDESLLATALREASEEVALSPPSFRLAGELDQRLTRSDILVTPFVGLVPADVSFSANPAEIASIFSLPIAHLCSPGVVEFADVERFGMHYQVPHLDYKGYQLWGVTAMMLVNLANVVFDTGIAMRPKPYEHSD